MRRRNTSDFPEYPHDTLQDARGKMGHSNRAREQKTCAYFTDGFPLVGARCVVPYIGLLALGEIGSGIRDIMLACDLSVLVDCDNGYDDVKTVVHAINFYERLVAQAVFFEDQISPKRREHIAGKRLLDPEQMEANIPAARRITNSDTFIIARMGELEVCGLDEALPRRRGHTLC
jgi:2-methylisocitrate lyase-like PEP mutase family enzyme